MISQRPSCEVGSNGADLLNGIREGDPEAWRTVANAFRPQLRDLAASAMPAEVSSRVDASDMVQQTLAEAGESFHTFLGGSLPELYVWLTAILKHNVSDTVRQHVLAQRRSVRVEFRFNDSPSSGQGWEGVCAADQTSPSMAAARNEAEVRLSRALESLPSRQRVAVRMRHLEGRALAEIAAQLNCTLQAAAAVITRGLRRLNESLQDLD